MAKAALRSLWARACRLIGVLGRRERAAKDQLQILCYHRILPASEKHTYFCPDLVVTPQAFRAQCETLAAHYRVLPLAEASAAERDLAPAEFRSEMIQEGFIEALEHYELRPYPGRITLFRPPLDRTFVLPGGRLADEYREIQDDHNHWDPFAIGGIDRFEVPGDHDSMVLEPHVRVLGSKVCQVLREALERTELAHS